MTKRGSFKDFKSGQGYQIRAKRFQIGILNWCRTSFSRVQISFSFVFSIAEIVLPSAKLCKSDFEIQRNGSFMKILNYIRRRIDLWGTPESRVSNTLWV